jgi:MYXO-CTERM domain-containing protein
VATVVDAGGADASSSDAGTGGDAKADAAGDASGDGATHEDSGSGSSSGGGMDGSVHADSGADSGGVHPGQDSGELPDSGDGGDNVGIVNGPTSETGGCGCKTAGGESSTSTGALAFGALALAGAFARSRRRGSTK